MDEQKLNEINLTGFNEACHLQYENVYMQEFPDCSLAKELMLVVTELAEAVQADRKVYFVDAELRFKEAINKFWLSEDADRKKAIYKKRINHTVQMEVVDAIMRLMAFCGKYSIDVENLVQIKTWYNQTRPIRNGKRY